MPSSEGGSIGGSTACHSVATIAADDSRKVRSTSTMSCRLPLISSPATARTSLPMTGIRMRSASGAQTETTTASRTPRRPPPSGCVPRPRPPPLYRGENRPRAGTGEIAGHVRQALRGEVAVGRRTEPSGLRAQAADARRLRQAHQGDGDGSAEQGRYGGQAGCREAGDAAYECDVRAEQSPARNHHGDGQRDRFKTLPRTGRRRSSSPPSRSAPISHITRPASSVSVRDAPPPTFRTSDA